MTTTPGLEQNQAAAQQRGATSATRPQSTLAQIGLSPVAQPMPRLRRWRADGTRSRDRSYRIRVPVPPKDSRDRDEAPFREQQRGVGRTTTWHTYDVYGPNRTSADDAPANVIEAKLAENDVRRGHEYA